MKDNNTAFSDFFKKKLEEAKATNSTSWDKPDPSVKKAVLQNISNEPSTTSTTAPGFKNWLLIGTTTALLLTSACIFHLYNQNKNLKETLGSKVACEKETKIITELKAKHSNELAALQQEKTTTSQPNNKIVEQNQLLTQQLSQQKNAIAQLDEEVRSLSKLSNKSKLDRETSIQNYLQSIELLNAKLESRNLDLLSQIENLTTNNRIAISPVQTKTEFPEIKVSENPSISKLPKLGSQLTSVNALKLLNYVQDEPLLPTQLKRKRFEIGYVYIHSWPNVWLNNSSLDQYIPINQNSPINTFFSLKRNFDISFNGIRFAFSLHNRFWINTGFSYSSSKIGGGFGGTIGYNPQTEESFDNQIATNAVHTSPYLGVNDTLNPIYVELSANQLVENDIVNVFVRHVRDLKLYTIPVSVEYLYGKGRLNGTISSGITWLRITGDRYITREANSTKTEITVLNPIEPILKESSNSFHLQTSIGLNYRLYNNFYTKTKLNINNKISQSNEYPASLGIGVDAGLYYRF